MSVTHSTVFRTAVADLHTSTLGATPKLVFRTVGSIGALGSAAATLTLTTGFQAAVSGVATANPIASDTNAAGQASPVATATLETSGGVVVSHFAVAASGSDINLTNGLTIGATDQVSCSSLTYQAMP